MRCDFARRFQRRPQRAPTFLQSGNTLVIAFLLSLLTIYLFLVAQFESLRDPLVVLVTVLMSL